MTLLVIIQDHLLKWGHVHSRIIAVQYHWTESYCIVVKPRIRHSYNIQLTGRWFICDASWNQRQITNRTQNTRGYMYLYIATAIDVLLLCMFQRTTKIQKAETWWRKETIQIDQIMYVVFIALMRLSHIHIYGRVLRKGLYKLTQVQHRSFYVI